MNSITNVQRAEAALKVLMELLPVAYATNSLEHWARLYTEGYLLKMRAMR